MGITVARGISVLLFALSWFKTKYTEFTEFSKGAKLPQFLFLFSSNSCLHQVGFKQNITEFTEFFQEAKAASVSLLVPWNKPTLSSTDGLELVMMQVKPCVGCLWFGFEMHIVLC